MIKKKKITKKKKVWSTGEEYEGGWKNNLQQGQGKHR